MVLLDFLDNKIHDSGVSLEMVASFIQVMMEICVSVVRKMVWYYSGSLEQESMTNSTRREFTVVQVVGLLSTGLQQNSILVVAGQPSLRVFPEP